MSSNLLKENIKPNTTNPDESKIPKTARYDSELNIYYGPQKFGFNYDLLFQNGEELQIEEVRAIQYYKMNDFANKKNAELLARINELELELKKIKSGKNNSNKKCDIATNTESTSVVSSAYVKPSESDYTIGNDNLTNVTYFSNYLTNYETTKQNEDITKEMDHFGGNNTMMMNSMYPLTPSDKSITLKTHEVRNMFENMLNQTDKFGNITTSSNDQTEMNEKSRNDKSANWTTTFCQSDSNKTNQNQQQKKDQSDLTKTNEFSIFVDNINSSSQTFKQNDSVKATKKYNEDGSLFVYENTLDSNTLTQLRQPFKTLIETSELKQNTSRTQDFKKSQENYLDQDNTEITNSLTKIIDFEPPAASTCFIRSLVPPPMSKSSDTTLKNNVNKIMKIDEHLETIVDCTTESSGNRSDQTMRDLEKEKQISTHLENIKTKLNEDSKFNLDNTDKNMSQIIDEDQMTTSTKWSNCLQIKSSSIVVATLKTDDKKQSINNFDSSGVQSIRQNKNLNLTQQESSSNKINTTLSAHTIINPTWDFSYMDICTETNEQETVGDDNDTLIQTSFQQKFAFSTTTVNNEDLIDDLVEKDKETLTNELLTSEKLNQTFNQEYHKLCFTINTIEMTPNMSRFNLSKLIDGQIKDFNQVEAKLDRAGNFESNLGKIKEKESDDENENENGNQVLDSTKTNSFSLVEMPHVTLAGESLKAEEAIAEMNNHFGNKTLSNELNLSTTGTLSPVCSSLQVTQLNETIANAIKDPFSYEVKNRLLNRGPINNLKKNPKYVSLLSKAPIIREKAGLVTLKDGATYNVLEEIGKGAYAKIYLICNKNDKKQKFALKVDVQATSWEFYITETIHERLAKMIDEKLLKVDVTNSFVKMIQFMKYSDGCFSAMNYYNNGSLLDLINYHVTKNENFPYWFVIYLTLEMLYIVDYLHKCQIIHTDIKPDNLLINMLPNSIDYFQPNKTKCLVLIDFNRSIDFSMMPQAEFDAQAANKSLLCCEMKSNKTWTYQIDYYGMLSSIHCIIFKKYMKVYTQNDRNRISNSLPRNYDKLFSQLFDTYLNVPNCKNIPDLEDWIQQFVILFKNELGSSFIKYLSYLNELNAAFSKKK